MIPRGQQQKNAVTLFFSSLLFPKRVSAGGRAARMLLFSTGDLLNRLHPLRCSALAVIDGNMDAN